MVHLFVSLPKATTTYTELPAKFCFARKGVVSSEWLKSYIAILCKEQTFIYFLNFISSKIFKMQDNASV